MRGGAKLTTLLSARYPAIYPGIEESPAIATPAQKRAVKTYRAHLAERGLVRFEVIAREGDRELVRALAKKLSEGAPETAQIRAAFSEPNEKYVPKKGGIVEELLKSPLAGSGVNFKRYRGPWRKVDL
jgi:hypothetical protein